MIMFTNIQGFVTRALAAVTLVLLAGTAQPQHYPRRVNDDAVTLVQSWYQRYLHRAVDPTGYEAWVTQLRNGVPARNVEAGILGSDEYFQRHNSDPAQFIVGLYVDVLGRSPSHTEVGIWLDKWDSFGGDREGLARAFLREARESWRGRY
jgi:hypothetical protein